MKYAAPLLALALLASPAIARDTILQIPLQDVLSMPEAKDKLDGSVKFYLAGQKTPKILKELDTDVSNQKTNGFNKSDEFGCRWSILSALIAFQNSAKKRGANAVIHLASYYKKNEVKNDTTIECHAGAFITGAALKGTYATINS